MPPFFPLWVMITHFLVFFLLLLARSGLEVLSAFPKLYWYDDCPPGRERARCTYLHIQIPAQIPGEPFERTQKLSYFLASNTTVPRAGARSPNGALYRSARSWNGSA